MKIVYRLSWMDRLKVRMSLAVTVELKSACIHVLPHIKYRASAVISETDAGEKDWCLFALDRKREDARRRILNALPLNCAQGKQIIVIDLDGPALLVSSERKK